MIPRRRFLEVFGAAALAFAAPPVAAQQGRIYRIGFLGNLAERGARETAFLEGLRGLGYVEGRNMVIDWRFAAGKLDRLPGLAAELAGAGLDLLVAEGIAAAVAARKATGTIPILMTNASDDPVRHGLAASLARPGGNVTGFIDVSAELAGKRLELLKELVPGVARVAIIWDPESPAATTQVREAETAARALGLQLQMLGAKHPDDLAKVFREAAQRRAQALMVVTYGMLNSQRQRVTDLEVKTRLPVMYTNLEFVLIGGLASYAPDVIEQHRRAATYVDRIFKGAKPGDLPIEQPTKFELVVNLKTAKALGLTIPQSVLVRADRVIE